MRYKKDQMGSVVHDGKTLTCSMGFEWPPIEVVAYGSPEEAREHITDPAMQRVQVWEKVCGLRSVGVDKCLTCKYVAQDGVLINQSDKGRRGASLRVRSQPFIAPKPAKTPPAPKASPGKR
jgi:hypothetical protein